MHNMLNDKQLKQGISYMAIIHERNLFSWKDFQNDIQNLGDLERLKLVIETLPDQKAYPHTVRFCEAMVRNDHPIQGNVEFDFSWNCL